VLNRQANRGPCFNLIGSKRTLLISCDYSRRIPSSLSCQIHPGQRWSNREARLNSLHPQWARGQRRIAPNEVRRAQQACPPFATNGPIWLAQLISSCSGDLNLVLDSILQSHSDICQQFSKWNLSLPSNDILSNTQFLLDGSNLGEKPSGIPGITGGRSQVGQVRLPKAIQCQHRQFAEVF